MVDTLEQKLAELREAREAALKKWDERVDELLAKLVEKRTDLAKADTACARAAAAQQPAAAPAQLPPQEVPPAAVPKEGDPAHQAAEAFAATLGAHLGGDLPPPIKAALALLTNATFAAGVQAVGEPPSREAHTTG